MAIFPISCQRLALTQSALHLSDFHGVLYIKPFPAHQQVMREMGKIHDANFEEGRKQQNRSFPNVR